MKFRWIAAFWLAFALVATLQTWVGMITHGHSLLRIALFEIVVWSGWIALTPVVFRLTERFPHRLLIHIFAACAAGVAHVAWWLGATIVIRPYDAMTVQAFAPNFPKMALVWLPVELIMYACVAAAAYAARLERSLTQARLHALELQIQPHFLFNTLNAVSSLIRARKNDEAIEVVAGLSDLLRYTLDHQNEQNVPLEEEIGMLQRYLDIQRTRFADRLEISIDVEPEALRAAVPTLILQPLAENAIRHGIARVAQPGRVEVRAFRKDRSLAIEMFNSGRLGEISGRGLGLRNTADRLRQLYGNAQSFALRETAGGVVASIVIPWRETACAS
jgi:two-component system, LytTR family, sensor kinase